MAVEVSKNIFELFSGKKRTRLGPTLVIALVVTAAVAIPLTYRAIDARNNPVQPAVVLAPADAQEIVVDTATSDPAPLDLATVAGRVLISLFDERASAVSFNLFAAGSDQAIVESQDRQGPQFDLVVSDTGGAGLFDTAKLQNGTYELFVTLRIDGEDHRTAVSFDVNNS